MTSESKITVRNSDKALLSLSPELLTKIICQLPSFTHIFVFAATCHRLRDIWTSNSTAVYTEVAPRCNLFLHRARILLADQGGPDSHSPQVSAKDVVQMVHNVHVIDHAIEIYERDICQHIKVGGTPNVDAERWYGKREGGRWHPRHLTKTERIRFTRAYYIVWDLMTLPPDSWQPRLEVLTLKQLYHILEMSTLTQSIGRGEEELPPARFPDEIPYSFRAGHGRSEKRSSLEKSIWAQLESAFERIHHSSPHYVETDALEEGSLGRFVVMWDHYQGTLKEVVCKRRPNAKRPLTDSEIQYCWGESEDEDGEGKREDAESWLLQQYRTSRK